MILNNNLRSTVSDLRAVIVQLLPIALPLLTDTLGSFHSRTSSASSPA